MSRERSFQHLPCGCLMAQKLLQHLSVAERLNVEVLTGALVVEVTTGQTVGDMLLKGGFVQNVAHIITFFIIRCKGKAKLCNPSALLRIIFSHIYFSSHGGGYQSLLVLLEKLYMFPALGDASANLGGFGVEVRGDSLLLGKRW